MRGATEGLLPQDGEGRRSKHPQPVLEGLVSQGLQQPQGIPPSASSYPSSPSNSLRRPHTAGDMNGHGDQDTESDDEGALQMPPSDGARGLHNGNKPAFGRAQSDMGQSRRKRQSSAAQDQRDNADSKSRMRHGWDNQLKSPEQANLLSQTFFMYYEDKRHETAGNLPPDYDPKSTVGEWRMRDRLKTVSAILAVCLNVGVDPPDVIKTNPCARLECWVDPIPQDSSSQSNTNNSNAQIGKNLQSQYENQSLRTRYKVIPDPTIEELKKYTTSLRRTAHAERILFHYNGHGVPKPTASGEVWCFNRSYTQYIPISLYDLQEWVGAPGLWVWDCSSAGGILTNFAEAAQKHQKNADEAAARDPTRQPHSPAKWTDSIHLAACQAHESLPTNPSLPADLFTSCLTTPITMAVRFFLLSNPLPATTHPSITLDLARNIPGKVSERRTPLGELNWIFTAITDTIAWNMLPKATFKRLFRQDLMVAALFRNFLLAQRVMRRYHCHPVSTPEIPAMHDHPLWQSWDLAVEMILAQLPRLIEQQKANEAAMENNASAMNVAATAPHVQQPVPGDLEYTHSDFFADQLSAFEVYLSSAPTTTTTLRNPGQGKSHNKVAKIQPPAQLPVVLQVLLSQVHRLRALILLSKFLDLGPWAVDLALGIGIFPYVLKLLQSQAVELKPPMVFIWARILAVDSSCQADLLKDHGSDYFTAILTSATGIPLGNVAEHRAMCAFVVAMFCKDFRAGKEEILSRNPEIIEALLSHMLDMENPLLRQFSCLCLSQLWRDYPPAKATGMAHQAHARILDRSHDPVPEVRAACLDALTSFVITGTGEPIPSAVVLEEETVISVLVAMGMDGSVMVRKELVVFYSVVVKKYEPRFLVAAWEQLNEEKNKRKGKDEKDTDGILDGTNSAVSNGLGHRRSLSAAPTSEPPDDRQTNLSQKTIYRAIWRQCMSMSCDPHPEVARNASIIVDYVVNSLLASPLGPSTNEVLDDIITDGARNQMNARSGDVAGMDALSRQRSKDLSRDLGGRPSTPPSPAASTASKADGHFSSLSRTASVAAGLKNVFGWGRTPTETSSPPSPSARGGHAHRGSVHSQHEKPYKSRPLTPADAATLPPDALDTVAGPPHQPPAKTPSSPGYVPRDLTQTPTLPLKSSFFQWSASYFREPQMRPSEADEPGSLDYNQRLWRRNRNDRIIASTQPLKEDAGRNRWDVPCGYFGIGAAPMKMLFHQFENHLITSDNRDSIAVWDWKEATQLARFSNGNPLGSRVTELRFINEDDSAMLLTGSSDGVIKIFRNYDSPSKIELASSFRALSDLVASDNQSAGLVFDWQQGQGRILVAGDDRVIRVWQAGHELCIADIPARSGSCITSLTSDQVEGHVFVAGFGNGTVRAYDQRVSPRESCFTAWDSRKTGHKSWVVGVHLQRGGLRELVSAESNGGVRLWDLRQATQPVATLPSHPRNPRVLRSLSVHEHAPVFATGGSDHTIRVYNTTDLKPLSVAEPYMSYLRLAQGSSRAAPITATAFHPHRLMLATGAVNDGHVNLFRCEVAEKAEGRRGVVEEWGA
ncbi:hypothetical protein MBLNU230_g6773t1 [Neophaeotheca triangularis]